MVELAEHQARQALATARSPAADPRYYAAHRREAGWAFSWRPDAGPPPIGVVVWVVADNGKVRSKALSQTIDSVLDSLMDM